MPRLALTAALVLASSLLSISGQANDRLQSALEQTQYNLDLRAFYFDRDFDQAGTPSATALSAGGIAKLETGSFQGLQLGAAYYGNFLIPVHERPQATGTALFETGTNDNLSFLGEAYLKYTLGKSSIQLGRQRLSTPLANDHDLRVLPDTYEAAVFRTREIANTVLEAGWVTRYSGFASKYNGFEDESAKWGKDGLGYLYLENTPNDNLRLRGQYLRALEDRGIAVQDYRYADAKVTLPNDVFIEGQYSGNNSLTGKDSTLWGLMTGIKIQDIDFALLYDKISGSPYKVIDAGPMYSDWQQGYANYEPSAALGGYVVFHPMPTVSVKLGHVKVSARESSTKDDFSESLLDATWKIDSASKLRLRYSLKNPSDAAYAANPTYPDRTDFRIIYYYSFAK